MSRSTAFLFAAILVSLAALCYLEWWRGGELTDIGERLGRLEVVPAPEPAA